MNRFVLDALDQERGLLLTAGNYCNHIDRFVSSILYVTCIHTNALDKPQSMGIFKLAGIWAFEAILFSSLSSLSRPSSSVVSDCSHAADCSHS